MASCNDYFSRESICVRLQIGKLPKGVQEHCDMSQVSEVYISFEPQSLRTVVNVARSHAYKRYA